MNTLTSIVVLWALGGLSFTILFGNFEKFAKQKAYKTALELIFTVLAWPFILLALFIYILKTL